MADVYVYAPAREQGEADIFVGVNGKGYRVPRGKPCTLPEAAAQELVKGYPEAMILDGIIDAGGGGGDGGVIKAEYEESDDYVIITNLTWQQMHDAFEAGKIVVLLTGTLDDARTMRTMYMIGINESEPTVYWALFDSYAGEDLSFEAAAADEHPKMSIGG